MREGEIEIMREGVRKRKRERMREVGGVKLFFYRNNCLAFRLKYRYLEIWKIYDDVS